MNNQINPKYLTDGTESPFLPGTNVQWAWDSTSIGLIKTCPRLYQYTMIDGWSAKHTSPHLRFGIEYHQALQDYDILRHEGVTHDDALFETVKETFLRSADFAPDMDTKAGKYKNRQTLIGLVIDYLDHYKDDPAKTYVKADGKPAVELSFRFELDFGPATTQDSAAYDRGEGYIGQPYLLCGHLDRVVEFNRELMVMDHKTTTTTPSQYYFDQYEPNNQMSLYIYAGRIILGTPIRGVCITAAQILLDSPNRFVRGFTHRTDDQIAEWIEDLRMVFQLAEQYATFNYWPMNDTACDKYGGCRFRKICSKSPDVREIFLKSDFIKQEPDERWNPLRSR